VFSLPALETKKTAQAGVEMPHIVIITPLFAIDEKDTINVPFLQLFCRELLKKNITLSIIAEQYPFSHNFIWHGARVYTIKRNTPKIFYKFLRKPWLIKTLKRIHAEHKVDVIHNFWFNILGIISQEFALKNKIPHLITMAGQDVLPDNPVLPKINSYSGKLFCLSPFHLHKLREHYNVSASAIPWGIEPIQTVETERHIDLIICGWINTVKNLNLFLEIVVELKKGNTIKKAVICGGGPLFDQLQTDIKKMNLQEIIEIKNSIPRTEVLALMQQSKILVHTSNFESYGLVITEGLACGCAVISKPVGIAWNNPDVITANSLSDFVTEIKKALRAKPGPLDMEKYLIKNTGEEYVKIYNKVVS
jgi:glycosyltransferase involved in cell wall biosynthesis